MIYGRNRVAPEKISPIADSVLPLLIYGNSMELQMKTKIYFLRGENRFVRYVGKTCRTLENRLWGHLHEARKDHRCRKCNGIRALLRKGLDPIIDLITEVKGNGNGAERVYIKWLRSKGIDLWNGTEGGDGNSNPSIEVRKKISKTKKGTNTGKTNPFFGKHHPKEMIEWMREIKKGKYDGEKNPNYGNHILKGHKRPEHSEWMKKNNPFKGKHHKEESILQAKASIRKGFENGRVGTWKGKHTPPHKEGCRCASCMSKRGLSYGYDRTNLPPVKDSTRLKMGMAHKQHKENCKCCACMSKKGTGYRWRK